MGGGVLCYDCFLWCGLDRVSFGGSFAGVANRARLPRLSRHARFFSAFVLTGGKKTEKNGNLILPLSAFRFPLSAFAFRFPISSFPPVFIDAPSTTSPARSTCRRQAKALEGMTPLHLAAKDGHMGCSGFDIVLNHFLRHHPEPVALGRVPATTPQEAVLERS